MSRRARALDARRLLRFIADHESLALTSEEFPEFGEDQIRALLRTLAEAAAQPDPPGRPASPPIGGASTAASRPKIASTRGGSPSARSTPSSSSRDPSTTRRMVLNTDGASRGNPGPAGAGWILATVGGDVLHRGGAFLGRRTNNEAEYEAVIRGLRTALDLGAEDVALRSDSELLIKQLNGEYQVRNERIAVLHQQAREIMRHLKRVDARHVPREQNRAADALANEAIDRAAAPHA